MPIYHNVGHGKIENDKVNDKIGGVSLGAAGVSHFKQGYLILSAL